MVGERYKLIKRNPKIEAKNKKKRNSAIDNHKEVVEVEGNENIHNINFFGLLCFKYCFHTLNDLSFSLLLAFLTFFLSTSSSFDFLITNYIHSFIYISVLYKSN